ncbi:cathepsin L isoform X1 [Halyomorpha halys]|uniref:cathepsin L isoform X1 n=1 Tax=Halyomorpha halys TaxID=286706 RepID=UPI0006D4D695|nr:cathepsin L1-like isoform X1 [Halyomorpha halys]KAE8574109.1 Cat41 [Halyomorpha halys]
MRLLLLVSIVAGNSLSSHHWNTFKLSHEKKYENLSEERYRRSVYLENKLKIDLHNQRYEKGLVSYKLEINHFGDLTHDEFRTTMNRLNASGPTKPSLVTTLQRPRNISLPKSIDWREKGAVTGVKNQGKCGACWSFSATGALEAQHFLKTGKLISLSEQNLIDCSGEYGNEGCIGGLMDWAFQYVVDNKGVDTENSYPYEESEKACRFKTRDVGTKATAYAIIPEGDERALQEAVATIGPISAGVDGTHYSFEYYKGGLYYEQNCSQRVSHAVLIVGYGTNNKGQDYWILKNSWKETWGEGGYMRLARNRGNHCGVTNRASYPLL